MERRQAERAGDQSEGRYALQAWPSVLAQLRLRSPQHSQVQQGKPRDCDPSFHSDQLVTQSCGEICGGLMQEAGRACRGPERGQAGSAGLAVRASSAQSGSTTAQPDIYNNA